MGYKKQTKFETLSGMLEYQNLEERHIDGTDDRSDFESFKKSQFRKSREWREFCEMMVERAGHKCERCGKESKILVIHHRNPKQYDDLTIENFVVLDNVCHLQIESYCGTEEKMRQCPRVDRRFLTLYPYVQKDRDVLAKGTGKFLVRKWAQEWDSTKHEGKWINTKPLSDGKRHEIIEARDFMRNHPELFKV
jgi:hypothetical protein